VGRLHLFSIRRRFQVKKIITLLLKIGVTVLLFVLLFKKLGFNVILNEILTADPLFLIIACLIFLISMVLSAIQWNLLLSHQGVLIGRKKTFSLYMIGHFFNNFLPGAMGGDLIKVYKLKSDHKRGKEGLVATFLDRFAGLFMLSVFALISAAYLHSRPDISFSGNLYLYIIATFALFFATLIFLFSRTASRLIYGVLLKNINPMNLRDKINDLHNFLHLYRGNRLLYVKVFILSSVIQFLRISVHWFVAHSIGFDIPFVYFLVFVPLIALIASLPLSFGGLGVREGLGQLLFAAAGFSGTLAVATQFLASIVGIAVSLLGGLIFIFQRRTTVEENNNVTNQPS
jgi:uncharacterized protein (TIRG00374 family)